MNTNAAASPASLYADFDEDSAQSYWHAEGLEGLIDHQMGTASDGAFPPHLVDLVRLHRLVRMRMAASVLEFGVGFSTVILADALAKNEQDFALLPETPRLRTPNPFHLHCVDASDVWLERAKSRLPARLVPRVHFCSSSVSAGTWNGRLCHFYDTLPDAVPDFIYLDGPAPEDINGQIRGLSFQVKDRTVMGADLLFMEPTLLPGAFILVDGRLNNARFLQRNFQRPFSCRLLPGTDVTVFELNEPPLGPHSHDLASLVRSHQIQKKS